MTQLTAPDRHRLATEDVRLSHRDRTSGAGPMAGGRPNGVGCRRQCQRWSTPCRCGTSPQCCNGAARSCHHQRSLPLTGRFGTVDISTEVLKQGGRFLTARATLAAAGRPVLTVLGTFGEVGPPADVLLVDGDPPSQPPPDACVRIEATEEFPPPFSCPRRYPPPSRRCDVLGRSAEWPDRNARCSAFPCEPIDSIGLLCLVDAMPPTIFNADFPIHWTPTIELTTHVRGRPTPGWFRGEATTRFITGGFLEIDVEIWDSTDQLVAQARQLASCRGPGLHHTPTSCRPGRNGTMSRVISIDGPSQSPTAPPGTAPRQVLVIVCAGVVLASLDLFIVNVALPQIAEPSHVESQRVVLGAQWLCDRLCIAAGLLRPASGPLSERSGLPARCRHLHPRLAAWQHRPAWTMLVAFRLVQAAGAALLTPTSLGLVLASYEPDQRHGAVRAWTAAGGFAAALGPVIGGLLVAVDWRLVFLVNVPIGIVALAVGWYRLPHVSGQDVERPDPLGAILVTAGVAALTFGLVKGSDWGWGSASILSTLTGGVVLTALFVLHCLTSRAPLIHPSLFRSRPFTGASLVALTFSASFGAMLLSIVLWEQGVWGWSALRSGSPSPPVRSWCLCSPSWSPADSSPDGGRPSSSGSGAQCSVWGSDGGRLR